MGKSVVNAPGVELASSADFIVAIADGSLVEAISGVEGVEEVLEVVKTPWSGSSSFWVGRWDFRGEFRGAPG